MERRLTVHVTNAPSFGKRDSKTGKTKICIQNTFAFKVKSEDDVVRQLGYLKSDGMKVTKHYFSNFK